MKRTKKNYRLLIRIEIWILIFVSTILMIQYARSNPAIMRQVTLATTRIPESFTELYFENHINLPTQIESGKYYTYEFTIHNLENRDMEYPYTVYLERGDNQTAIDQGIVEVKKDEYKTVENKVGPLKSLRTKVVVELTDKNQIISFWMDKI